MVRKILRVGRLLENFPNRGRVVPELRDPNLRELQAAGYRVIYKVESEETVIVTVLHGRRNLAGSE